MPKKIEEIPEKFKTYEEAGRFWGAHDSMDYKDILEEVEFKVNFQKVKKITTKTYNGKTGQPDRRTSGFLVLRFSGFLIVLS